MRRDELVQKLQKRPFHPFRLYVTDGGWYDVPHPEMMLVTKRSAVIGMRGPRPNEGSDGGYPEIERYTDVDLMHVTRVEELPESQHRPS